MHRIKTRVDRLFRRRMETNHADLLATGMVLCDFWEFPQSLTYQCGLQRLCQSRMTSMHENYTAER